MRQTLFRINLVDLWSLDPIGGVTAIGAGYIALLALVFFAAAKLYGATRTRRPGGRDANPTPPHWGDYILPVILLAAAFAVRQVMLARNPELLAKGLPVFGYGVMVFLGFLFGGWVAIRQAKRVGIPAETIWDLVTWVFVAGIGGARLFYLVQKHETVFAGVRGPQDFFLRVVNLADGGLVLLGGVLAVVAAVIFFCRRRGIPPLRMGDVLVAPFFIGLAFGRIGCLLNGCCFGDRCTLPWAIHFPPGSAAWGALVDRGYIDPSAATTYGLHPTQVYASITAFLLAAVTAAYFRRRPYDGSVLVVGTLLYGVKRVILEFLRGDELGQFGTMFTISQWISAGIFATGLILWAYLAAARHRPRPGVGLTSGSPKLARG